MNVIGADDGHIVGLAGLQAVNGCFAGGDGAEVVCILLCFQRFGVEAFKEVTSFIVAQFCRRRAIVIQNYFNSPLSICIRQFHIICYAANIDFVIRIILDCAVYRAGEIQHIDSSFVATGSTIRQPHKPQNIPSAHVVGYQIFLAVY